ncbi:hypothetical protein ACIO3O_07495 [Streptomyces sp. NPDC087440]|uniref:hypothetical protein n=1 Tax=Streptomyces sp. NPDC087440 TaxID=3365790 RepID=UPI003829AE8F
MGPDGGPLGETAHDAEWADAVRHALRCAGAFLAMLLVVDAGAETSSWARTAVWVGLALLLLVILVPVRVTAGAGWVSVRGVLGERVVRTDRLVAVRWAEGVAGRVVLRDTEGGRVELDPRVLVANPQLWHLVDEGVRASRAQTLRCGTAEVRRLGERVDGETARAVFRVSGLE